MKGFTNMRKVSALIVCILFLLSTLSLNFVALGAVSYVDEDGVTNSVTDYTVISGSGSYYMSDGWYVLNSDAAFQDAYSTGTVFVSGNANLILCDGCTLTCYGAVINENASLTVYGQSAGTGKLYSYRYGNTFAANGIRADGDLIINSGTVDARGSYQKAGISGYGTITINGGDVTAIGGESAAGIGAYYDDGNVNASASLVINGGTVTATGGNNAAGIGGASETGSATGGSWGTTVINGGTVIANAGTNSAGIGCGYLSNCGNVTINGGNVTAHNSTSGSYTGEAIGHYCSNLGLGGTMGVVAINGGNVVADGSIGGSAITLDWTNTTDSIYADSYTSANITILNDFQVGTTPVFATPDNIDGVTINAYDGPYYYVNLYDDDGQTPIDTPIKVIPGGIPVRPENPTKQGYSFHHWELADGTHYEFDTVLTSDIDVMASWNIQYETYYIDENGVRQTISGNDYVELCDTYQPTTITSGWYVATYSANYTERITISGDVKLIVPDTVTFNLTSGGIRVEQGNKLTIYGQSSSTGKVNCMYPGDYNAAIGSNGKYGPDSTESAGTIVINGAQIYARGGVYAAGIGGGRYSNGGNITINGGQVEAQGYISAAIGDGYNGIGTNVTINGGKVIAHGGAYSAAIGGANASKAGTSTVNINGGQVTANAYSYTNTSTHTTTTYYGIGSGSASKAVVNLNWTDATNDSVFATNYNSNSITFLKDFVIQNTTTVALLTNIDGNRIVPCTENVYTVDYLDETGNTEILSQEKYLEGQTVVQPNNPMKPGYEFVEWRLNGVAYDFTTPISGNIVLRAHWSAAPNIQYIDENGNTQVLTSGNYTIVESCAVTGVPSGWYVFMGDVTLSERVQAYGTINILLCDGCTVDIPQGITVTGSNALNVYGQSQQTGALNILNAANDNAAIGGTSTNTAGNININGGVVNVRGGSYAAAIGGGHYAGGGNITINGGTVNAVATNGAAIGSGYQSISSTSTYITINGGTVTASSSGNAIGSGINSYFNTITINGGNITATGHESYCGIGGDAKSGTDVPIVINGGNITATSGDHAAAIGASANKNIRAITINGGNITATCTGTHGVGIGSSPLASTPLCSLTLNWTSSTDSIYSVAYNVMEFTFQKDFIIEGTTTQATSSNIDDETIIPDTTVTVSFVDSDGITELAPSQTVTNGMTASTPNVKLVKYGYEFGGWMKDGSVFDFTTPIRDNTVLTAGWVPSSPIEYINEDGDISMCGAYYYLEDGMLSLSDAWYVVGEDLTFNDRITVTGTVSLILGDGTTLNAVKGITVNEGATLNIYAETRTAALSVTTPDDGYAGIGSEPNCNAGTINICSGTISVASYSNASAIGGGDGCVSGTVNYYGGIVNTDLVGVYYGYDSDDFDINLSWHNTSDSYYAVMYRGSVTLGSDFFYQGTRDLVTVNNLWQQTIVPATGFVEYIDENGERKACSTYTTLTDTDTNTSLANKWYVVSTDITVNARLTCTGTVHIILCDGATLNFRNVFVQNGSLYIYGQTANTGAMINTSPAAGYAGIGGFGNTTKQYCGNVYIYGGNITVTGGARAAGIGGSYTADSSEIVIQRATVNATGGLNGAGIGGGKESRNDGGITITDSDVTATGGQLAAGIGGGSIGVGGTVTINSGTVKAYGTTGGAGIGNGAGITSTAVGVTGVPNEHFNITICGGYVEAHGGEIVTSSSVTGGGAGIGAGAGGESGSKTNGNVAIYGGNVKAYGVATLTVNPKTGPETTILSAGIGTATNISLSSDKRINLSLSWQYASDSIYATSYTVSSIEFNKYFVLQNTETIATASNIDGRTIVPLAGDPFFNLKDNASISIDRSNPNNILIFISDPTAKTLADIVSQLNNRADQIKAYNRSQTQISGTDALGTTFTVECWSVQDGPYAPAPYLCEKATVVLYGDINGDAEVDEDDFDLMMNYAVFNTDFVNGEELFYLAADINRDRCVDGFDLSKLDLLISMQA